MNRLSSLATILRWLGPWTAATRVPPGITREERRINDRLRAHVYRPRTRPLGHYLLAPGLHFQGPDDPRMDRFCRVLAAAGFVVMAPFLPDYLALMVAPSVLDDFEQCARAFALEAPRLTLFSVSFGSWPALAIAARMPDQVDGVITFGGYADFERTIRYCLGPGSDPLNPPALFRNLLPHLDAALPELVADAWLEMARRTWGQMELKAAGRLEPFAAALAAELPEAARELFWIGCGLRPGGGELLELAMTRGRQSYAFSNPGAIIAQVRCPVIICHGKDDDVIPWTEAEELYRALRERGPTRLYLTGLYGHTAVAKPGVRAMAREARTLLAMARALASAGAMRERYRR